MKYIIFGCGNKGIELSYIMDKNYLLGFMDNNPNKKTPDGSDLLTFDDIKEFNTNDFAYIIANSGANAIQISLQLQDLGYLNYITLDECKSNTTLNILC